MSNLAVIYKSKYGTTKQYAEWIAQALGVVLLEASSVKPPQLTAYDLVVYGGGLYAGGIDGVNLVTKNPCKQLIVFTVGLADPETTDYSPILTKNFSKEMLSKIKIFHLRGGMDYKNLRLIHKGMMGIVRKSALKIEQSQRSEEDKLFLETYGTKLNFMDKNAIVPVVEYINGLCSH